MRLWKSWFKCVLQLRGACSRSRSFSWMVLVLAGFCIRDDNFGVTSFVRSLKLRGVAYKRLLYTFHNPAICIDKLTELWIKLILKIFKPITHDGRFVCIADGIKVAKEGRKMPSVKKLHQESGNNSKSAFIMGHSFQALSLLVSAPQGLVAAIPFVSRIHEGTIWSNRDTRTLLDKLAALFLSLTPHFGKPTILVADAYYATKKIIIPLLEEGHHLISRARSNCVAYSPIEKSQKSPSPGRPKKYGEKIYLRNLVNSKQGYKTARSPFVGESQIEVSYLQKDLLWRPVGCIIRFVIVKHPKRGTIILMSTDVTMEPMAILMLYGHRFQIELGFRHAIYTLASYQYHFWMQEMTPIKRNSGNQHMHCKDSNYRRLVKRKIEAFHRYVQLGCVAQGLLMFLAITKHKAVWKACIPWFRTMHVDRAPSEFIVRQALQRYAVTFLHVSNPDSNLRKLLRCYREPRYFRPRRKSA